MFNYIQLRNREFIAAVNSHLGPDTDARGSRLARAVARAIEGGAPRFYFTYSTAVDMLYGDSRRANAVSSGLRRRQWADFSAAVRRRAERCSMPLDMAVAHTLALDPAPSFYLSLSQGLKIVHEHRRNKH